MANIAWSRERKGDVEPATNHRGIAITRPGPRVTSPGDVTDIGGIAVESSPAPETESPAGTVEHRAGNRKRRVPHWYLPAAGHWHGPGKSPASGWSRPEDSTQTGLSRSSLPNSVALCDPEECGSMRNR